MSNTPHQDGRGQPGSINTRGGSTDDSLSVMKRGLPNVPEKLYVGTPQAIPVAHLQQIIGGDRLVAGHVLPKIEIGARMVLYLLQRSEGQHSGPSNVTTSNISQIAALKDGSYLLETSSGSIYRIAFVSENRQAAPDGNLVLAGETLERFKRALLAEKICPKYEQAIRSLVVPDPVGGGTPCAGNTEEPRSFFAETTALRAQIGRDLAPGERNELFAKLAEIRARYNDCAVIGLSFADGIFEHRSGGDDLSLHVIGRSNDGALYWVWRPTSVPGVGEWFQAFPLLASKVSQQTRDAVDRALRSR